MKFVLILGAKSDIAKAVAKVFASNGYNLYLCARDVNELSDFKKDLEIRTCVRVELKEIDINNIEKHEEFYMGLEPKPEGIITTTGYLPDQKEAENSHMETIKTIYANYLGIVCFLNIVANDLEKRGKGFIVGISSVAGDRGRRSNYIYGSAKAGFTAYLSGLRNRLWHKGIRVITVKPGFVHTKMTKDMKLPPLLTATPEEVAKDVFKAVQKGKDVIYSRWFWKYIMLLIRLIPEPIFKRLNL